MNNYLGVGLKILFLYSNSEQDNIKIGPYFAQENSRQIVWYHVPQTSSETRQIFLYNYVIAQPILLHTHVTSCMYSSRYLNSI